MAETDGGIDIRLSAVFLVIVYPPASLDSLQQQPRRQSDEADAFCRIMFLEGADNVIHGKKLIASKPQDQARFRHPFKRVSAHNRSAAIRSVEFDVGLFAFGNGRQFDRVCRRIGRGRLCLR
jgi:hypothetical protein